MIFRYSLLLYLLIEFIMLIQVIGEKDKRKILLRGILFLVPAIGLTVFICISCTFREVMHEIIKFLTIMYVIVTFSMTLNFIKVKKKIPALVFGTLFLLPIILVLFLWYSSVSIL